MKEKCLQLNKSEAVEVGVSRGQVLTFINEAEVGQSPMFFCTETETEQLAISV